MLNQSLKTEIEPNSIAVFLIFSVLNNILPFCIFGYIDYNNIIFYIRVIIGLLNIGLIFDQIIPFKYKSLRLWYIYFVYTLNISFISFFMYFSQINNYQWLINLIITNFVLLYLVNFIFFIIITSLGAILSFLTYYILYKNTNDLYQYLLSNISELIFTGIYSVIISSFFIYLKEKNKLKQMESMKTLAYSIAHDMRTPLLSMRSNLELLFDNLTVSSRDQAITRYNRLIFLLNKANSNIDAMLMNIKHNVNLNIQPLNLSKLVNELLEDYPFTQEEIKHFNIIYSDFISEVEVDKLYFNHVIINILKNALYQRKKYNRGSIELKVKEGAVIIEDDIIGIQDDEKLKIFNLFYTKERKGTGLGLSFSKMVIEKMGGKIICESEYLQYTKFTLMFKKVKNK
jgi:signal transduction histidine kinase